MFVSSKVSYAKSGCEECSYKTVPKNAEKTVHKFSSQAVAQSHSLKKVFLEISAIEEGNRKQGNRKHKSQ